MNQQNFLLTGAGFTRNWGGWLSDELWSVLYGKKELREDTNIKRILWEHREKGFEYALGVVQKELNAQSVALFESAVSQIFENMDDGLSSGYNHLGGDHRQLELFLAGFDLIFTLNQDLLIERKFENLGNGIAAQLINRNNIKGCIHPGIVSQSSSTFIGTYITCTSKGKNNCNTIQYPVQQDFLIPEDYIGYIKLHGSYNWKEENKGLMIVGSNKKEQIKQHQILNRYHEIFRESISRSNAKLLVIGYGFGDAHINDAILEGVKNGLQLYVWDICGIQKAINFLCKGDERILHEALIGYSSRSLKETTVRGFHAEMTRIKVEFFGRYF